MPFWKKAFSKRTGVYYPQTVVQGKPVETETIAKDLSKISTVSNSDVQAVLGDISGVMHTRMSQGKSVHIKGLGYFRYVLDTKGVKDVKDFNFEKQVQAVRVQFIPERTRTSGGAYTRALVDTEQLEWIELPATAEDTTPGGGGGNDGDQEVNPPRIIPFGQRKSTGDCSRQCFPFEKNRNDWDSGAPSSHEAPVSRFPTLFLHF